jgi:hypothetical protein
MSSWKDLLSEARPRNHFVQLYKDEDTLTRRVSHYLREGLQREESVIVIASQPHRKSFTEQLARDEVDVEKVLDLGQLIVLDAEETLSRCMVDGHPDESRFHHTLSGVLGDAGESARSLRLYGEMVDVLWRNGDFRSAVRLEHLWHQLLYRQELPLLCAYRIDILGREFRENDFQAVLAIHSHLLSVGSGDQLETAVFRAMEEVLGQGEVEALRGLIGASHFPRITLCPAEAVVLWISRALAGHCDEILARARNHYMALCAEAGNG